MAANPRLDNNRRRGSGEERRPEPRYLAVGRVARPHGVRGELRVEILTDHPEHLPLRHYYFLADPDRLDHPRQYAVEFARLHRDVLLLKLVGCDSRNEADKLRGALVQVRMEEAVPLEPGEYYHCRRSSRRDTHTRDHGSGAHP
jgi:16S rRNA processing protein RimM